MAATSTTFYYLSLDHYYQKQYFLKHNGKWLPTPFKLCSPWNVNLVGVIRGHPPLGVPIFLEACKH